MNLTLLDNNRCPTDPVTARCTISNSSVLIWELTLNDGESQECGVVCPNTQQLIICNSPLFDVVKLTQCACDDKIVVSEATVNVNASNAILSCINEQASKEDNVSLSAKGKE